MSTAISVEKLTKRFDTVTALSCISFEVKSGEIMGFLGPNGAGKTTTLRILTGIINPTEGAVRIDGLDVAEQSLEVRKRIGYLPEHVALPPELRVNEYLHYRACIKGVAARDRKRRVAEVLERCALTDVARRLTGRLSKGYRQRVALADCLVHQPKILVLDEPTVGLDPHQIRQTRSLITELGQSSTILLSTHILPEVEMLCQRVTIINRGAIVAVDTPEQLRKRLQGTQLVRVTVRGDHAAIEPALKQLPGVVRVSPQGINNGTSTYDVEAQSGADVREAIFHLAVQQQWILQELAPLQASLEDVFIHLTTEEQQT